jgi:signal transduction histidine kinase
MDEEGIAKALKPFEQADRTRSRRYEGTGLGLYLCNSLVHLFSGEIIVDSEIDVGTTVTLQFPSSRTVRK